jgi:hypothetical protein
VEGSHQGDCHRHHCLQECFGQHSQLLLFESVEKVVIKTSKTKKLSTWTHTFICLANRKQNQVPSPQEWEILQLAGLGEKKVTLSTFSDVSCNYHHFFQNFK